MRVHLSTRTHVSVHMTATTDTLCTCIGSDHHMTGTATLNNIGTSNRLLVLLLSQLSPIHQCVLRLSRCQFACSCWFFSSLVSVFMLLLIGHTESTAIEPAFHDQPRKGKDALFAALKTKNGLRRSGCRIDWGVQETTHHGIFNVLHLQTRRSHGEQMARQCG